ncbi:High choriolytic enzyme 1 [Taenia solium]|eukprot:TsM_000121700 transcript=TsM_000121700 gene=TsM_000121700
MADDRCTLFAPRRCISYPICRHTSFRPSNGHEGDRVCAGSREENKSLLIYSGLDQMRSPWLTFLLVTVVLVKCEESPLIRTKRAAIPVNALSWPESVIPYIIDKSVFKGEELKQLATAIEVWNNETCVRFRPYQRSDRNWIRITDGSGCFSEYMGFKGIPGEQTVTLSKNGCRFYGLYLHELGHVMGLDHEHTRADRDKYLHVNDAGVPENFKLFFTKKTKENLLTYDSPYDLQSIMHYGRSSFSVYADKVPIAVKDEKMKHVLADVYVKDISFWDARTLNLHYHCQDKCKNIQPNCPFPGYIDKFCKCQTPGEFSQRRCVDIHGEFDCRKLADRLECYRNASFMTAYCRKTCGFCYKHTLSAAAMSSLACKDRQENCVYWARVGHCAKTSGYMKMMCPESCGYCNLTKSDSSESDGCRDRYLYPSDCEAWAKEGKCTSNKLWIHFNCAKSCGLCTTPRRYRADITTPSPSTTMKTTTTRGFTTKAPNTCKNNYGTQNCRLFASRRMCLTHKSWMERQCRAICGFCQTETTTAVPKMVTTNSPADRTTTRTEPLKIGTNVTKSPPNVRPKGANLKEALLEACRNGDSPGECPKYRSYCRNASIFQRCPNICKNCAPCKDTSKNCKALKQSGYCKHYPSSTIPICRKTCGVCFE